MKTTSPLIFLILFIGALSHEHHIDFKNIQPSNNEDKLKKLEESITANNTDIPLIKPILFGFGNYSQKDGAITINAYLKKARRYIPKKYFGFNVIIKYKGIKLNQDNTENVFIKGKLMKRKNNDDMFLIYKLKIYPKENKDIESITSLGNYEISNSKNLKSNMELNDIAPSALLIPDNLQNQKEDLNNVINKIVYFQNTELKYDREYWFSFAGDLSENIEFKNEKNIVQVIYSGAKKRIKCSLTNISNLRYNISCYAKNSVYERFSGAYINITNLLKNQIDTLLMIETEEEEDLVYIEHYVHDERKMARIKELDSGLSGSAIFTILFSCFVVVGTSAIIFNKKNNNNFVY
jgi:hypothetical protein